MKTSGIIFFAIDLLKALYSGYNNISHEKVLEAKEIERLKVKNQKVQWKPYIGVGMMVLGGAMLVLNRKKSLPK